ncbi:hypothetical protein QJS66_19025 [Kocuria rhizophila]|nr:hypothetical protein QJS66_19025 [Kocuria rhizophila]
MRRSHRVHGGGGAAPRPGAQRDHLTAPASGTAALGHPGGPVPAVHARAGRCSPGSWLVAVFAICYIFFPHAALRRGPGLPPLHRALAQPTNRVELEDEVIEDSYTDAEARRKELEPDSADALAGTTPPPQSTVMPRLTNPHILSTGISSRRSGRTAAPRSPPGVMA